MVLMELICREFHPDLSGVLAEYRKRRTRSLGQRLEQCRTGIRFPYQNGLGTSIPELGAGIYFDESNDVMSGGKNVSCFECTTIQDQHGIVITRQRRYNHLLQKSEIQSMRLR